MSNKTFTVLALALCAVLLAATLAVACTHNNTVYTCRQIESAAVCAAGE